MAIVVAAATSVSAASIDVVSSLITIGCCLWAASSNGKAILWPRKPSDPEKQAIEGREDSVDAERDRQWDRSSL